MTVAENPAAMHWLDPAERGPSFASAGYDGSGLYGEGEKVVLCDV